MGGAGARPFDWQPLCLDSQQPPALVPGTTPALVVNSFGKGKSVWLAGPIEAGLPEVNPVLLVHLIKHVLPGPYKLSWKRIPPIEMTLFHQQDKKRLLVGS